MPNPQQVPARVYTGRNLLYLMRRIRSPCRLRSAPISGKRISWDSDAQAVGRFLMENVISGFSVRRVYDRVPYNRRAGYNEPQQISEGNIHE